MPYLVEPSYEIRSCPTLEDIRRIFEPVCRICYKSEGKVAPGSDLRLLKHIITCGHLAMAEFVGDLVVTFVSNRGFTHEIVRHRLCSFAQECISGNTKVTKKYTIKQLFDHSNTPYGKTHNKTLRLKSCNESGEIIPNSMTNIWYKGEAEVFHVRTALGYEIDATINHRFMNPDHSFSLLGDLTVGSSIMVNGRPTLLINDKDAGWHLGMIAHPDVIVSIERKGLDSVYDIEMSNPYHNYIANGFVVHNSTRYCNYSHDRFDSHIAVVPIPDDWLKLDDPVQILEAQQIFEIAFNQAEANYLELVRMGVPAEIARDVLPIGLKAEISVKANVTEWRHIFKLRCSKRAHPRMRQLMLPLLKEVNERLPIVFADLAAEFCQ